MKILICDTDSIALIRGKWYDVLIINGDTLFGVERNGKLSIHMKLENIGMKGKIYNGCSNHVLSSE